MKKTLSVMFLFLVFTGCTEKKNVLYIDNLGLCSTPVAKLYLNDVVVENSSQTFNIAPNDIKDSLVDALNETNCFVILASHRSDEYVVNTKVNLSQEKETVEETLFKKSEKERLVMAISLSANDSNSKVLANAKSELLIDKSKILGFKTGPDVTGDNRIILKNATKKVSIALKDGFSKLK